MIPKVFNFIWIDKGKSIDYIGYASILTKMLIYGDTHKYVLWTNNTNLEFEGKNELIDRGLIISDYTKRYIRPDSNSLESKHYRFNKGARFISDWLRFQIMYELGGIYSDLDSISINKLPEEFYDYDYVTCTESNGIDRIIGFFMCDVNSDYLSEYMKLRLRIEREVNNVRLNNLIDAKNKLILSSNAFVPMSYDVKYLKSFQANNESIDQFMNECTYELHLYSTNLDKSRTRSYFESQVRDYVNSLR